MRAGAWRSVLHQLKGWQRPSQASEGIVDSAGRAFSPDSGLRETAAETYLEKYLERFARYSCSFNVLQFNRMSPLVCARKTELFYCLYYPRILKPAKPDLRVEGFNQFAGDDHAGLASYVSPAIGQMVRFQLDEFWTS